MLKSKEPKHKMIGLMLKQARMKKAEKVEKTAAPIYADYCPQRQDHCFMYKLQKKEIAKGK